MPEPPVSEGNELFPRSYGRPVVGDHPSEATDGFGNRILLGKLRRKQMKPCHIAMRYIL